MFEFDSLREISGTMKKNKLRTFLTGFSVAWGIFMLIILLAAGNGLRNGIAYNFRDLADNYVNCWSGYTTLPYKGFLPNRSIRFTEEDIYAIKRHFPEVNLISPVNSRNDTITFNKEYLTGSVRAVHPDFNSIQYIPVLAGKGRFINEVDLMQRRKVIVISPRMAEVLFRDSIEPTGSYVKIGNLMFQVIGVYEEENKSNDSPAYIPFTTGRLLYDNNNRVRNIRFTLTGINTEEAEEAFREQFRHFMARRHQFDPEDKNAVDMWTSGREFRMWRGMTNGIALFIWIIGIGTLMAGIVGVSNIMLITVRERTREFGIRKAIGAKPSSILGLIIVESVLVTAVFGYIGLVLGIGLTEAVNYVLEMAGVGASSGGNPGEDTTVFRNPTVNMGIAMAATGVLIVAGVLAGYFPARKATKITAIDAIRADE
jgi:putative ABC transport system permease protein